MKRLILASLLAMVGLGLTVTPSQAYTKKVYRHPVVKKPTYVAYVHPDYVYYGTQVVNPDGQILLTWGLPDNDGTCHIAYTEGNSPVYQYRTAAPCRDRSTVIGGLVPGKIYKFSISANGAPWTREQKSARATATMMRLR